MERAAVVVVAATVNVVNRRGWNISFRRIIKRLVLRAWGDYYYYYYYYYYHHHHHHHNYNHNHNHCHKKFISSVQYFSGLSNCTTGRTYQVQFFFVRNILPGGNDKILYQGCPAWSGKWPWPLLRAGSWAGHVIIIIVVLNFINYFVFFTVQGYS